MASLTKVSEGKNYSIWTDGKSECIKVERIRSSFPHLGAEQVQIDDKKIDPKTGKPQERRSRNIVGMLDKKTHVDAKNALKGVMERLLLKNDAKVRPENKFLRDGDGEGVEQKEYAGHWTIHCSNSGVAPTVRDVKGAVMRDDREIDKKFYGGCWVSMMIRPWYFGGKAKNDSETYPKRVSCGIVTVQFIKDDEPFGEGHVDDSEAWGDSSGDKSDTEDDDGLGGGSTDDDDDL